MTTHGYATHGPDKPLEYFEFERRQVSPDDVAIQIEYCGICHSDIHSARNEWGGAIYPMVPGHEIIGKVTSVGNAVKKYKEGDLVGVGCLIDSCATCSSCQEGLENYCETGFTLTYNSQIPGTDRPTFGGYSNHIVVKESFVLKVPENLDPAASAPLLCAGITTYSPLRHVGLKKNDKIAILGLGGLGHMGVKLAASFGAEVTVLSRSPQKKADAQKLGAHHFVLTTEDEEVSKMTNHFDYILDTVSAKHDLVQAFGMLKREGTLIMVGASAEPLDLNVFPLILNRRKMMGSLIGGLPETQEMLDHCGKHNIVSDIELIKAKQINEAYERTIAGDVKYRFVIDCKTFKD